MAKRGKTKGRHHHPLDKGKPKKVRFYQEFYLIVCEDEKTEPEYFEGFKECFPAQSLFLVTVGTGLSPLGIIEKAIELRAAKSLEFGKDIDHVWAVFDVDDHGAGGKVTANFKEAETIAKVDHINLAISNEVFELWLLLHFVKIDHTAVYPRASIYDMLNDAAKNHKADFQYVHGDAEILRLTKQYGNEDLAIESALKLISYHKDRDILTSNPITHVVSLVIELKEWVHYFKYEKE